MAVFATLGFIDELSTGDVTAALAVVAIELAAVAVIGGAVALVASWGAGRLAVFRREPAVDVAVRRRRARRAVVGVIVPIGIGLLAYDGWLISRGVDLAAQTRELLAAFTTAAWQRGQDAMLKLALAALGVVIARRLVRWVLRVVEAAINRGIASATTTAVSPHCLRASTGSCSLPGGCWWPCTRSSSSGRRQGFSTAC